MGNVIPITPVTFPEREFERYYDLSYELESYHPTLTITPEYYRFTKVGDSIRGIFLGYRTISKRDKQCFDCILWMNAGKLFLNGSKCLVNDTKQAKLSIGTPIEIQLVDNRSKYQKFIVRIIQPRG